ncbi:MAG TPA: hypothetical protein VIZ68_03890 [Thermoplasmata archaeon]
MGNVRGPRRTHHGAGLGVLALLLAAFVGLLAAVPAAHGATATAPLTGGISGSARVGSGLNATYLVNAHGGPAEAPNGTQVGIYSYKASLAATDRTGAAILPATGVLVNGAISLILKAPKVVESLTIYVLVTSKLSDANVSQNFSYTVQIVQPYVLTASLIVGSTASATPFFLTVSLDGQPVGGISVPALSPGASFPLSFSYVPSDLSPGWHTFSLSLAQQHGLVTFAGGSEQFSSSFYVAGEPPNYSVWYFAGLSAFVGAIFIWSTRVGARRRGRPKK